MRARRTTLFSVALAVAALLVAAPAAASTIPDITRISPAVSGEYPQAPVHVYGTHLGTPLAVRFGSLTGSIDLRHSNDHDLLVWPPIVHRSYRTQVAVYTANYGRSSWSDPQASFLFEPPPSVVSVVPNAGPTSGAETVRVYGHDFIGVRGVTVDGVAASRVTPLSHSALTFWLPKHAPGLAVVRVITASGTSLPAARFSYVAPPAIENLDMSVGSSNPTGWRPTVQITGRSFASNSVVTFGGVRATSVVVRSSSTLYATPPVHSPGDVDVRVSTLGGTSPVTSADRFEYTGPNPDQWTYRASHPILQGYMVAVSCPVSTFCAAIDGGFVSLFDGGAWQPPVELEANPNVRLLRAISCASAVSCVAVDQYGNTFRMTGRAWTAAPRAPSEVSSVSCPTDTMCAAVGMDSARYIALLTSTGWTKELLPTGAQPVDVTCSGPLRCVAADYALGVDVWDGTSWTAHAVTGMPQPLHVSCAPSGKCAVSDLYSVATSDGGDTWTSPVRVLGSTVVARLACAESACVAMSSAGSSSAFDGTTWSPATTPLTAPLNWTALSCSTAASCVAVDTRGEAMVGDGRNWNAPEPVFVSGSVDEAVSCPTATFCVEVDALGNAFTFDGSTLSAPTRALVTNREPADVSCASDHFCMMVSSDGQAATFDGMSWTKVADEPVPDSAVSCISSSFCATPHAVYDGTQWRPVPDPLAFPTDISCTSTTFCLAVGFQAAYVFDGTRWTRSAGYTRSGTSVSCVDPAFCLTVGDNQAPALLRNGRWTVLPFSGTSDSDVSCASETFCAVADGGSIRVFDGERWSDPADRGEGFEISCATADVCTALYSGHVFTSARTP